MLEQHKIAVREVKLRQDHKSPLTKRILMDLSREWRKPAFLCVQTRNKWEERTRTLPTSSCIVKITNSNHVKILLDLQAHDVRFATITRGILLHMAVQAA
jgi:hypothetical protein